MLERGSIASVRHFIIRQTQAHYWKEVMSERKNRRANGVDIQILAESLHELSLVLHSTNEGEHNATTKIRSVILKSNLAVYSVK